MKAMILAAGEGRRMLPLTAITPKPLLRAHGDYLIANLIRQLAHAGIVDIIINVYHLADEIIRVLDNGKKYGVNITYSDERPHGQRLETGGGIRLALPLLGDKPFIVVSSDISTNYDFSQLKKPASSLAHLVLVKNPPFHPQGDFNLESNGLVSKDSRNPLTYANIGIFSPQLFTQLPIARLPLSRVLLPNILQQKISGEPFNGLWDNIGNPEQLAQHQSNTVE